jgi:IclR-like helix-turn-helix domain-containing protein
MATLNLANAVDRTLADLHADAVELAWLWEERVASGVDDLNKGEMGVMDYLVVWTERRGRPDVTCPIRKVAAHAGISPSYAHRLLAQLTRKGLLIKHSSGWSKTRKRLDGTTTHRGQAAIYALALITVLPAKGDLVKSPRMPKSPAGGRVEGGHPGMICTTYECTRRHCPNTHFDRNTNTGPYFAETLVAVYWISWRDFDEATRRLMIQRGGHRKIRRGDWGLNIRLKATDERFELARFPTIRRATEASAEFDVRPHRPDTVSPGPAVSPRSTP